MSVTTIINKKKPVAIIRKQLIKKKQMFFPIELYNKNRTHLYL